jgi:hypothetical protein
VIPEVDQSVKIENTSADTVLALSNDVSHAILVPAAVKRRCLHILRERDWRGTVIVVKVFSAALFLLLERHLSRIEQVVIDAEYPGHEGQIKGMLTNWMRKKQPGFSPANLVFGHVGKRSPAHKMAINITRGRGKADRVLSAEEILGLLKTRNRGSRSRGGGSTLV